jgi:hypothetical protein
LKLDLKRAGQEGELETKTRTQEHLLSEITPCGISEKLHDCVLNQPANLQFCVVLRREEESASNLSMLQNSCDAFAGARSESELAEIMNLLSGKKTNLEVDMQ